MNTSTRQYPKISIITPSFNQGAFLEQTIQSVLDQQYPALEYLIIDGGSTDNSVEIIKKYADRLAYWVSEPDGGQSTAINKGIARCTGEIVNWLCSDDVLEPGALQIIGRTFAGKPQADVVVGNCRIIDPAGKEKGMLRAIPARIQLMPCCNAIPQPSCFYRRRLLDRRVPVATDFVYAMDFELWNYFKHKHAYFECLPDVLSSFREYGTNKTSVGGFKIAMEEARVYRKYVDESVPLTFWQRYLRHPIVRRRRSAARLSRTLHIMEKIVNRSLGIFYGRDRVHAMDWNVWY